MSARAQVGGRAEEFGSVDCYIQACARDSSIVTVFEDSRSVWCSAMNQGQCRFREKKPVTYRKRRMQVDVRQHLNELRAARKRVLKKRGHETRLRSNRRFLTMEAWETYKRTNPGADSNLVSNTNMIKGKAVTRVVVFLMPQGHYDLIDDEIEGVEHEEEVGDGTLLLREGQQERIYDHISNSLGALAEDTLYDPAFFADPSGSGVVQRGVAQDACVASAGDGDEAEPSSCDGESEESLDMGPISVSRFAKPESKISLAKPMVTTTPKGKAAKSSSSTCTRPPGRTSAASSIKAVFRKEAAAASLYLRSPRSGLATSPPASSSGSHKAVLDVNRLLEDNKFST